MNFQQGLSGLNATSRNLEVIGNNVANANTYGAKTSRAEFADMYANMVGGAGSSASGIGVRVATTSQLFTQGGISTTENPLDLAINGSGFFQVQDPSGNQLYSRNGQFKVDRDGFVVNNQSQKLQGYAADTSGTIIPTIIQPIQLPTAGIAPKATDEITMGLNLDSRGAITTPAAAPSINFDDPATYNNATSMSVYDATGKDVALTFYFQKSAVNAGTGDVTWDVYATANGSTVGGSAAAPTPVTQMVFPPNGAAPSSPAAPVTLNIPATSTTVGGVTTQTSQPINGISFDPLKSTQFSTGFGVTNLDQTGYAPGQLSGVQVEGDGVVRARYSNGKTMAVAQLELANFRNPQGLQPVGGNAWAATYTSGDALKGTPTSGNFGALQAGALEESNVDLTAELVNMITAQRQYQANAQTIKTQDGVLQTLVNLK
jgi:flagellar hook protein FlgE